MTLIERILELFDKYGEEVVAEMQTRLKSNGKVATSTLLNSIGYDARKTSTDKAELVFFMADYGIYVDKGRKPGKMPPISKIEKWCRVKGIPEAAAFPIARKIGRFGIAPTNFFTIPTTRRLKQFQDKVSKESAKFIEAELIKK